MIHRSILIPVAVALLDTLFLAGCTDPNGASAIHEVKAGSIHLSRWDVDTSRYELTVTLANGRSETVQSFELFATAVVALPPSGDSSVDGEEETIKSALALKRRCRIAPDTSSAVELVFPSPFPFIPQRGDLSLLDVGFRRIRLDDGTTLPGSIIYPYEVHEE